MTCRKRALEEKLRLRFPDVADARTIAGAAGFDVTTINLTGAPSTFWGAILDHAGTMKAVQALVDRVEEALRQAPKDSETRAAIESVRQVAAAGGMGSPLRLLLSGERPFLGRTTLRDIVPELQNWNSAASILVVRGDPDSGRTETQVLLAEGSDPARERFVLLDEQMPLHSTLRSIWGTAGAPGEAPVIGADALSTEPALLIDFWTDVKLALDTNDRRLWVLFDDLDKGPGRLAVRMLAEVLAVRLRDLSFQRRVRLVMLGYPNPQLPAKVPSALVRNDTTETLGDSHVRAFLDFCMKAQGKTLLPGWLENKAAEICAQAQAKTTADMPFLEALNGQLRAWYRGL